MDLFLLLVAVAVIGGVAAVAAGRVRGGLEDPTTSRPYRPLPQGPLSAADVDALTFSLGFRGYRMDEVDRVLDRLRDEIADRDAELLALRRRLEHGPGLEEPRGQDAPAAPVDRDGTR